MRSRFPSRVGRLFALAALVLGAGAASAFATATLTTSEAINACQNQQSGILRVLLQEEPCRSYEQPLTWNVQGPPGEQGEPGPQGPPGAGTFGFASVLADGTIDRDRSADNVLSVTRTVVAGTPSSPLYCVELSAPPRTVVASVEDTRTTGPTPPFPPGTILFRGIVVNATARPEVAESFGCASGTEAAVAMSGDTGVPFYISFN
jgi:hypothetical protein